MQGQAVTSAYLFKQPMVLIFYAATGARFAWPRSKNWPSATRDIEGLRSVGGEKSRPAPGRVAGAKQTPARRWIGPNNEAGNDEWPRKSPRPEGLDRKGDSALRRLGGRPGRRVAPCLAPSGGQRGPWISAAHAPVAGIAFISPQRRQRAPRCPSALPSPALPGRRRQHPGPPTWHRLPLRHPTGLQAGLRQRHRDAHRRHHLHPAAASCGPTRRTTTGCGRSRGLTWRC